MKIIFSFILAITLLFGASTMRVEAIDLGGGLAKKAAVRSGFDANTNETTFSGTLGTVVKGALSFLGVLFMLLMVYAGYLWMNARGDEGKVDKAQDIIRAAVIGMVLTIAAYSITNYVVPAVVQRTTGGAPAAPSTSITPGP